MALVLYRCRLLVSKWLGQESVLAQMVVTE
jgi:hypothetical protein